MALRRIWLLSQDPQIRRTLALGFYGLSPKRKSPYSVEMTE